MHPIFEQITPGYKPGQSTGFRVHQSSVAHRILHARSYATLVLVSLAALLGGCTKQPGGVIDPIGTPPFVKTVTAFPDSIVMKQLPQSNGILTVTIRVQAGVTHQTGAADISSINAAIIASGSTEPFLTLPLHDDGLSPDSVSGDGVYSALVQFTIPRSASGVFRIRVVATDVQGFVSNSVESPLFMVRDSHLPVLSNLSAPDSVFLPAGGTVTIPMSIRATDPDGQADINQVYFRNLDASDPTKMYVMNNDGSAAGSVPGDSTYAIIISAAEATNVRRTYRFAFQAANNLGDTCASLLHSITIH